MDDPAKELAATVVKRPPSHGPGSSKAAWQAFAEQAIDINVGLWDLIDDQSETIRVLQAEVKLLRDQIATRKPAGGRPRTPDKTVARIEHALAEGKSTREIANQFGVSAMQVSRIGKRRRNRETAGRTQNS